MRRYGKTIFYISSIQKSSGKSIDYWAITIDRFYFQNRKRPLISEIKTVIKRFAKALRTRIRKNEKTNSETIYTFALNDYIGSTLKEVNFKLEGTINWDLTQFKYELIHFKYKQKAECNWLQVEKIYNTGTINFPCMLPKRKSCNSPQKIQVKDMYIGQILTVKVQRSYYSSVRTKQRVLVTGFALTTNNILYPIVQRYERKNSNIYFHEMEQQTITEGWTVPQARAEDLLYYSKTLQNLYNRNKYQNLLNLPVKIKDSLGFIKKFEYRIPYCDRKQLCKFIIYSYTQKESLNHKYYEHYELISQKYFTDDMKEIDEHLTGLLNVSANDLLTI